MTRRSVIRIMRQRWFGSGLMPTALVAAALAIPANADIVFNNYGTGICGADAVCVAQNGQGGGDPISGLAADPADVEMIADAFTSGGNFKLSDVILPLTHATGGTYDVYLTADAAGVPGAVLESWIGVAGAGVFAFPTPSITLTSLLNPVLNSGTKYWLVVGADSTNTNGAWDRVIFPEGAGATAADLLANVNHPNGSGIPTLAGPWFNDDSQFNAFRVDGTAVVSTSAVPEPGALWILGTGLAGLLAVVGRRVK
jgi:PEP-CTERM motif-containing protein